MPLPPTVSPPPRAVVLGNGGELSSVWRQWLELVHKRLGGSQGKPIIGDVAVFETVVAFGALASAASVTLIKAATGEQWKIREIVLSGAGTNFSGGDRLLTIGDGTAAYTVMPAATLQSLAPGRWGDAGVPYPATAAHLTLASVVSTDVTVQYSGGTTDYTAGSCTIVITAERVA